eukprot:gene3428-2379_t
MLYVVVIRCFVVVAGSHCGLWTHLLGINNTSWRCVNSLVSDGFVYTVGICSCYFYVRELHQGYRVCDELRLLLLGFTLLKVWINFGVGLMICFGFTFLFVVVCLRSDLCMKDVLFCAGFNLSIACILNVYIVVTGCAKSLDLLH